MSGQAGNCAHSPLYNPIIHSGSKTMTKKSLANRFLASATTIRKIAKNTISLTTAYAILANIKGFRSTQAMLRTSGETLPQITPAYVLTTKERQTVIYDTGLTLFATDQTLGGHPAIINDDLGITWMALPPTCENTEIVTTGYVAELKEENALYLFSHKTKEMLLKDVAQFLINKDLIKKEDIEKTKEIKSLISTVATNNGIKINKMQHDSIKIKYKSDRTKNNIDYPWLPQVAIPETYDQPESSGILTLNLQNQGIENQDITIAQSRIDARAILFTSSLADIHSYQETIENLFVKLELMILDESGDEIWTQSSSLNTTINDLIAFYNNHLPDPLKISQLTDLTEIHLESIRKNHQTEIDDATSVWNTRIEAIQANLAYYIMTINNQKI